MQARDTVLGLATLLTLTLAGCDGATGPSGPYVEAADHVPVTHADALLFLTQDAVPAATMDALFHGTVSMDEEGCLRLATEGDYAVTAVWPHGYGVEREDGAVIITDADGHTVGELGGSFSLAGGQVDQLLESLGFTDADRELAAARCPGKYWIVAGS